MSRKSRIIYSWLKSSNFSEKTFHQLLNNPKRGTNMITPGKMSRKLIIHERLIEGFKVLTAQSSEASGRHIIFLHGGAYVAEASRGHRYLIQKLALSYSFKVTFIDYPLSPEYDASTTVRIVELAYKEIAKQYQQDTIFLLGDSSGGGLALALLQLLSSGNEARMPQKTVLVSPWLDISMSNPEIADFIEKDVLLDFEGLKACGKLYAGGLDAKSPLVSPIYGKLENLSMIKIFVSDHELFYPDCIALKTMLDFASGSSADLSIKQGMIHDWIVMPLRERDETIREIAGFYR